MEEFNNMNLDELLNASSGNTMTGQLFESADVEVLINKEEANEETQKEGEVLADDNLSNGETTENQENKTETEERPEMTNQEWAEENRKKAMEKLAEYEAVEKRIATLEGEMTLLNQELEGLISKIKQENKELIDKINAKSNEIDMANNEQEKIKEALLPLQREVYLVNKEDKTLKYNKIQSTYVAPTEKNQFDLKKFREEQKDFWKEHIEVMNPYAKITEVSDYLKISTSKK